MKDYDLGQLNDKEFESVSIDILSRHLRKKIKRYTPVDGAGVDGRFFTPGKSRILIQVKHWAKYGLDALALNLKNTELKNIQGINPSKCVLVTSISLSPRDKRALRNILFPYIKSDTDIYAREDLIQLMLAKKRFYKKYYKLRLSSTDTLKALLNAAITGAGTFLFHEIIEASRKYVVTNDHKGALDILKNRHAVIITGEPGIGKTTLADHLSINYALNGFDLVYIEGSISEAESLYRNDRKQLFCFDDFLGRNFLRVQSLKEIAGIINFIRRVARDNSTRIVLASSAGILEQAVNLSGMSEEDNFDIEKYVLNIGSLTRLDKARILYNHIWFSELNEDYIDDIYVDNRYRKIIDHHHFNPRLIAFVTDANKVSGIPSDRYWFFIKDTLDCPEDAWGHVFHDQLSDHARIITALVAFNGREIQEQPLRDAFLSIVNRQHQEDGYYGVSDFDASIQLDVGTVISRAIQPHTGHVVYDLLNPAIGDYIINYFGGNPDAICLYYEALETPDSLYSLESLLGSRLVTTELMHDVLARLFHSSIVNGESGKSQGYKLHLADLCAAAVDLSDDEKDSVAALLGAVNFAEITKNDVTHICGLFAWCLTHAAIGSNKGGLLAFVDSVLNEPLDHEHYLCIDNLLGLPGGEAGGLLLTRLKTQITEFWQRQISSHIKETGLLDDYLHADDETSARGVLAHQVEALVSVYNIEFEWPDIELICEYCDLEQILEDNHRRASWEDATFEEGIDVESQASVTESVIDDLFVRN